MTYHYRLMGLLSLIAIALIVWMSIVTSPLNFKCSQANQPLMAIELIPDNCATQIYDMVANSQNRKVLISAISIDDSFVGIYWLLFSGMGLLLSQALSRRVSVLGPITVGVASIAAITDYYFENTRLVAFLSNPIDLAVFKLQILPIVFYKWSFVFSAVGLISILLLLHPRAVRRLGWIFLVAAATGLIGAGLLKLPSSLAENAGPLLGLGSLMMLIGLVLLTPLLLGCPKEFVIDKDGDRMENSNPDKKTDVIKARAILRGEKWNASDIKELAKSLSDEMQFGYARKILRRARTDDTIEKPPELLKAIGQLEVFCTYKDPDLPTDLKLSRALKILQGIDNLATTEDRETLGFAGAIYKRRWEFTANHADLERSLGYYLRGAKVPMEKDEGYNRINAAYVLDLLAAEEITQAGKSENPDKEMSLHRLQQAREIRQTLKEKLRSFEKPYWWFYATLAEAHFGLGEYAEAASLIKKAPSAPEWQKESTARQLASLAKLQKAAGCAYVNESSVKSVIQAVAEDPDAVQSTLRGKIGLALSGGGFRASLFHIGVLAKLAELDVLRNVEVLSCVSGGSIIGAHYYLALRSLLKQKADKEITQGHYVKIVEDIEKDFLEGVKKNIRTRVILNPVKTFRMMFSTYSRTIRAGELMEKYLFHEAVKTNQDNDASTEFCIDDLRTIPSGELDDFNPKTKNWKRKSKVPILVLNATTLNTGHNWHFTATYMGEPPGSINSEVDGNYRLRRVYYTDAPRDYKGIRLGTAVGASAAVPGVFDPILLPNLYPDRTVLLADGGVQDNQGIGALLEQDCSILLVSDASGQMDAINEPGAGILSVLLRSNSILQARLRDLEYRELAARQQSSQLRSMMFIHLKKDLDTNPVDWIGCQDRYEASDNRSRSAPRTLTSYGIEKDIQRALSGIRTDLDSFCEAEAYALMYSGYRMTEASIPEILKPKPQEQATDKKETKVPWTFLKLEDVMKNSQHKDYDRLKNVLEVGSKSAFKIWYLSGPLRAYTGLIAVAAFLYIGWILAQNWNESIPFDIRIQSVVYWLLTILFFAVAGFVLDLLIGKLGRDFLKAIDIRSTIKRILFAVGASLFGWLIALIHLSIFDRWFLRRGSLNEVLRSNQKTRPAATTDAKSVDTKPVG